MLPPVLANDRVAKALLALVSDIVLDAPVTVARSPRAAAVIDPVPPASSMLPLAYNAKDVATVDEIAPDTLMSPALGAPPAVRAPIRMMPRPVKLSSSVSVRPRTEAESAPPRSIVRPVVNGTKFTTPADVRDSDPVEVN